MSGQAGASALNEIEGLVRKYLYWWEGSDVLPSEAARQVVRLVLGHNRVEHALGEIKGRASRARDPGLRVRSRDMRRWIVHLVALCLGLSVKIDGLPYGSRSSRPNPRLTSRRQLDHAQEAQGRQEVLSDG